VLFLRRDDLIRFTARFGYAARGIVYLATGLIALLAAVELRGAAVGTEGALAAAAGWPLGQVWLTLAGVGLVAFSAWRVAQAVFDADRLGGSRLALVKRAGKGISALVHLALAWTALELSDAIGDISEDAEARAQAAAVLALPFGRLLLLGVGAAVGLAAAGNLFKGARHTFEHDLVCLEGMRRWALRLGRFGYIARGVALAFVALYLAEAALTGDADQARSLGGALQTLESRPGGSLVLAAVAAGFGAFGIYGLVQARWRRIRAPEDVVSRDPRPPSPLSARR
jgi:hypothetical protein